ncbi:hypothetical protein [Streptomyces flaveolus]|uniref:hypothetical protein n=1 Tax=Streptomyces flaveolus TaxID=67297 RepID=UPI0037FBD856
MTNVQSRKGRVMAFRSVRIRVDNMSASPLSLVDAPLEHGEFTSAGAPPVTVGPDQQVEWRAASNGVLTGTEGKVTYRLSGGETVTIGWANPAVGNTFFSFQIADPGGNFTFFSRHFSLKPGEEPDAPLYVVTQGDMDGSGQIIPLPFQEHLKPHAWFDIGLRDRREPVRLGRWLRSIGVNPAGGLRAIQKGRFNVKNFRTLMAPPPDWNGVIV